MKAVLDSSVLISAFLSPIGAPAELLLRAPTGAFSLCLSSEILAETAEVLLRPKHRKGRHFEPQQVARFCDDLLAVAVPVLDLPNVRAVPDDPKDDMIVATAVAAGADCLVTGDRRHLLPLGSYLGIRIVAPREFLELLRG
jgi:putative PIN family toxin of toxin-antitoxin system